MLVQSYGLCTPSHPICVINIADSEYKDFTSTLFVFPVKVLCLMKPLLMSLVLYLEKVNVSL